MPGYSVTYSVVDNATKQIDAINKRIQQLRAPMDRLAKSSQRFLDVSGLSKVADGFSGIASAASNVVSSLTRIVPILGTITGAASIAGMVKLVGSFTEWSAALARNSDSLNTTSQRLQAFQNASRLAGGSADDMTEALKGLQRTAADAVLGTNAVAAQRFALAFGGAGIALRDANGQMREVTDILPEVFKYIDSFARAEDRMQVATELGTRALYEQYQTFRLAGRPMSEFIKEAEKLGLITARDQKAMLEYRQSVNRLSISFEKLGYVLAGTVSQALEPLIKDFTTWAGENAPEIERTIRQIGEDFKEWYKKGGWEELKATLTSIWNILKFVGQHAETIVTLFAIGWGIKAVAGVAQLTAALGYAGAGLLGAGGVGLLGALGVGAALMASMGAAWKLLHEGSGQPGTATDPNNPNRFGDPSIPPMPGGAGAPPSGGGGGGGGGGKGAGGALAEGAQTAISKAEGTYGPNGIDWNVQAGERPGSTSANLENMTIADVAKLRGPDFGGLQINRVHLQAGSPALGGLDPNTTKFTRDVQQQMAGRIKTMQGFGAWNGFKNHPQGIALLRQAEQAQQAINAGPMGSPPTGGAGSAGAAVDQMVAMAGSNGRDVREFLKDPNGVMRRDPDLGNWCAAFTSAYLQHAGLTGPNSLLARDFANWGDKVALENVRKGDVLVNKDLSPGRAHVGVATGRTRQGEGGTEVETISSNSIGPGGELQNLPGLRWRSDVNARRSKQLAKMQEDAIAKAAAAPKSSPAIGPDAGVPAWQGAQGQRAQLNGGGRGANGEVNVTVTHKNPPPGAQMRASSQGDGVNIAPVRTEYQDLATV